MNDLVTRLPELVTAPAWRQRAVLGRLSRPGSLVRLLDEIAADEDATRRIAGESYRHPLGFDKYVLWCRHPAGRLRMHVWWPEDEHGTEHVHNHRFAFSSVVVVGLLRVTLYERSERGQPHARYTDSTPLQGEGWVLNPQGTVTIAPSATLEVGAGAAYSQAARTFHHVRVAGGLTVTMFLEGALTRPYSEVLLQPGQPLPDRTTRRPFAPEELRERFTILSSGLRGRLDTADRRRIVDG